MKAPVSSKAVVPVSVPLNDNQIHAAMSSLSLISYRRAFDTCDVARHSSEEQSGDDSGSLSSDGRAGEGLLSSSSTCLTSVRFFLSFRSHFFSNFLSRVLLFQSGFPPFAPSLRLLRLRLSDRVSPDSRRGFHDLFELDLLEPLRLSRESLLFLYRSERVSRSSSTSSACFFKRPARSL